MFAPSKKLLGYKTVTERPDVTTPTLEIPTNFIKFNEFIGNPIHPATQQQMPLTPHQLDFFKQINESPKHMYHLNKARQMGFTELVIRILLFYACTKYPPGKIIIMAGTRLDTTKDIFQRMLALLINFNLAERFLDGDRRKDSIRVYSKPIRELQGDDLYGSAVPAHGVLKSRHAYVPG